MTDAMDTTQLIYVAGYGRSGSTLLDTLLGNHPDVFGAGELTWLFQHALDARDCSCGRPVRDCSVWMPVLARVFHALPSMDCARAAALTLRTESLTGSRRDQDLYARLWNETFDAIRHCSGKRVIVDSSKSSRLAHHRLPLFAQHLALPVRAIHLVRDPRGVMWSTFRGSNRRLEEGRLERLAGGMTRGLLSWLFSNLSIEMVRWRLRPLKMLRIRYEDLVKQPDETFAELSRFLEFAVDTVIERANRGDTLDPGHGIAGNRMRRAGTIHLRVDQEWHTQLPRRARVTSLLALPLLKKYRYR